MRRWVFGLYALAALAAGPSCGPELPGSGTSFIEWVAGVDVTTTAGASDAGSQDPGTPGAPTATTVAGSVFERGTYELYELGQAFRGEKWLVSGLPATMGTRSFLLVLLDQDQDLLLREIVSTGRPLQHVVRSDTEMLYLGVTPAYGRAAGAFAFDVQCYGGATVPEPRPQWVYLNFAGGADVSVHSRDGISFPSFDAGLLGPAYAGETATIKAAIVAAMRADYYDYNLIITTSDEGPAPDGPHATVHFGGSDSRLLGLADSVDQYNADIWQAAMIYVNAFADFAVMQLTADEMGQMIGNVASHELGHLLGLFHTRVPTDVMDTTGTAWDLAADQSFERGALEESVFPTGYENSPARLAEILGLAPKDTTSRPMKPVLTYDALRKQQLRSLVRNELRHRCGNCLDPDE